MALAFWRRTGRQAKTVRGARTQDEPADLRIRARRRLIGAAALLLTAAIVVPMVLDPVPRRSNDDIALDIPSEKTPFTPRLALPPVPAADNVPLAPPPDAPEKSADAPVPAAGGKKAEEQRASTLLEGKTDTKPPAVTKTGKFVVQAAAPASETAARNLSEKLRNAGLASYTEKVETKQGARYRVRLGPYASRDEADDVRTRLKAQGISANLVTL